MGKLVKWDELPDIKIQVKNYQEHIEKSIKEIGGRIINDKDIKLIFVCGPSSSGKTTFSKMLENYLDENGREAQTLSMDDFFIDRDKIELLPDGLKNFDSIRALDTREMNKCFAEIIEKGNAMIPRFDFIRGKREEEFIPFVLKEKEVVIIEGIHSFNSIVQDSLPKGVNINIFIEPATDMYFNQGLTIDHIELRLIRRMIRDLHTRGHRIDQTLRQWSHVRYSENKNVYNYRKNAHYEVDTFCTYELMVYRALLYKHLDKADSRLVRIINVLEHVTPLSPSAVPKDSLIVEFTKFENP